MERDAPVPGLDAARRKKLDGVSLKPTGEGIRLSPASKLEKGTWSLHSAR